MLERFYKNILTGEGYKVAHFEARTYDQIKIVSDAAERAMQRNGDRPIGEPFFGTFIANPKPHRFTTRWEAHIVYLPKERREELSGRLPLE